MDGAELSAERTKTLPEHRATSPFGFPKRQELRWGRKKTTQNVILSLDLETTRQEDIVELQPKQLNEEENNCILGQVSTRSEMVTHACLLILNAYGTVI